MLSLASHFDSLEHQYDHQLNHDQHHVHLHDHHLQYDHELDHNHNYDQVGVAESNVMLSLASHFDSLEAERCMAKMEMRRVKVIIIIIIMIIIIIIITIIIIIMIIIIIIIIIITIITRRDPFASLGETLHTRQRAACDGENLRW